MRLRLDHLLVLAREVFADEGERFHGDAAKDLPVPLRDLGCPRLRGPGAREPKVRAPLSRPVFGDMVVSMKKPTSALLEHVMAPVRVTARVAGSRATEATVRKTVFGRNWVGMFNVPVAPTDLE